MAGKANLRRANFANVRVKTGAVNGRESLKSGDARLKIIQKKRSKLVDARDRLAQMAKKTDARAKIVKLRQIRITGVSALVNESVRPVGSSILMKTDRNGKISLSTNKSKKTNSPGNINAAIKKELGLAEGGNLRKRPLPSSKNQMMMQLQRANNLSGFRSAPRQVNSNNERFTRNINQTRAFVPPFVIKRTIRNDTIREMPPPFDFPPQRPVDPSLYTWVRPPTRQTPLKMAHMDGIRQSVEVTARNNYMEAVAEDWNYADPSLRSFKMSSMFLDEDDNDDIEEIIPHRNIASGRIKTGVHARLDTPAVSNSNNQSQGIFSGQAKAKVVVPVGHRIVVSNLQPTVTQDDIRELFEDIGELLVSRLVRPGTAEVIYKNLKDAQKAVDTYHNRQLDGQPMKCLLVNKRPVNNPTAPALHSSSSRGSPSVLRSSGGITKKTVTNKVSSSNKLVPDLSTIHKVLFRKT